MTKLKLDNHTVTQALARFVSNVLSPLVMPSYGVFLVLWGSFLSSLEAGDRMAILLVMFGITCILPMFFIGFLHNIKVIGNPRLVERHERVLPYVFAIACYVGGCFYLDHVHAPLWFVMFAAGGCLAVVVCAIVNHWWKISAHMAGIGGLVALVYTMHIQMLEAFNMLWVLIVTIMLAGILGAARIAMGRHDVYQVLAGALVGYGSVKLMMMLFG